METLNFSNLESEILSAFNQGNDNYEKMIEVCSIDENTIHSVLEGLISKGILTINTKTKKFEYQTKVEGEIVILDGNLLLPTTVIKLDDKLLVSRGKWYEFPTDFDIRRIVWNVQLEQKTKSTLVDMINNSVLKEKKSQIKHSSQYDNIRKKIVPYTQNIGLYLNSIGDELADVSIIFRTFIAPGTEIVTKHDGFKVSTVITTKELMDELYKPLEERNYVENIKLNKIYNLSDFIFSKNEIPIKRENGLLTYVKLTGVKKMFELSFYEMSVTGQASKIDVESYESVDKGIERLKQLLDFAQQKLNEDDFLIEFE